MDGLLHSEHGVGLHTVFKWLAGAAPIKEDWTDHDHGEDNDQRRRQGLERFNHASQHGTTIHDTMLPAVLLTCDIFQI